MDSKSPNHQRIFRQVCNFCNGDHLNDNCPAYVTVGERKQVPNRLGCCYVCLKRGHRAFECLTKKTCFFCKRENHHHRSLCHQNVNNYSDPLNKFKLLDFKKELNSRHKSLEKSRLQGIQKAANNEPLPENAKTLCYRSHINVSEFNQILNELHQTKTDLEDSKKENVFLKERISKLEAEQEILHTSVNRNTTIQQFNNEIIKLKENIKNVERKINALPIDLQDTLKGTSAIAGGKARSNVTHGIGTERRL